MEGRNFRTKIVDRTYVDDEGIRWIIDYKTGDAHEGGNMEKFFEEEIRDATGHNWSPTNRLIRLQGETRPIKKASVLSPPPTPGGNS